MELRYVIGVIKIDFQFTVGGVETTGKVATVEMLLHRSRSMSLSSRHLIF